MQKGGGAMRQSPTKAKGPPHNRSQWEQKRKWHLNEESKGMKAHDPKKREEEEGKENRYV